MTDRPRIPPSLQPRDEPVPEPAPLPPAVDPVAAPPPPPAQSPRRPGLFRRIWRGFIQTLGWTVLVLILIGLIPPGIVLWLRYNPPPTTSFMKQSKVQPVQYAWVPKEQIPETLRRAVVAAEDQKFYMHWGFDFMAIAEALEHNEKSKKKRRASTITQQTAKNLFLWPSRSWTRKGLEVTFTLLLEGLWPKERILEVYLNVAEFGPGIYGCEAAAQKFFRKNCMKLTAAETAHLAAVLPNPTKWKADRPGPYVQSRVDWILNQLGHAPRYAAVPAEEPDLPVEDADAVNGTGGRTETTPGPGTAPDLTAPVPTQSGEPGAEVMPGDQPEDLAPADAPAPEPEAAPAAQDESGEPGELGPESAGGERPRYTP